MPPKMQSHLSPFHKPLPSNMRVTEDGDMVNSTHPGARNLSLKSTLTLPNSSLTIPRLGFGVYLSPDATCVKSCTYALNNGYRHIDTAQYYRNEASVGEAVRKSGIPREEIYITTKIFAAGGNVEKSYQKCLESVKKVAGDDPTGYVDLFLIHSPSGGLEKRKEMWQALERLQEEGKVKSIGVSNFGIGHIEEMKGYAKSWPPAVNQIELHPWCQQREICQYCDKHNIVTTAYSPLVRNQKAHDPTLVGVARKHGRTSAQVLIRYCLQKGWAPLPKSDTPSRIEENADVYGFELDDEDMKVLDDLDEGESGAIVEAVSNE